MPGTDFDLGRLLQPIGEEAFFRDSWEKQSLHIPRRNPDYYRGLLSTADVDNVVAFTRPKFLDPAPFAPDVPRKKSFVQGWLAERPANDAVQYPGVPELHRVYEEGRTVVVMTMQHRWPAAALLCRHLEAVFHCPVHANMYLTPKGAQGFDAHFDPHEVFVLQLEGHKNWRLYGASRPYPLIDERFNVPRDRLGTAREVRLEPGDLLYIPRGHVHEAFTSECASLHLTVGVNVYRWVDLLHEALTDLARDDERLRESVPPGLLDGGDPPSVVRERFKVLVEAFAGGARLDEAFHRLGDRFFEELEPLPVGRFVPSADTDGMDLDTVLERTAPTLCRVMENDQSAVLEWPGGRIAGPPRLAAAFRFIANARQFAVRDLPEGLGAEGKLVLARRLVRERLLTVADRRP